MKRTSDVAADIATVKDKPGSYEWWYFDAGDDNGAYHIVVIFHQGCPFSPRYMRSYEKRPDHPTALADHHPAVSISVYQHGQTLYYSMTQYSPYDAEFNGNRVRLRVGNHQLDGLVEDGLLSYSLRLDEKLPDGTHLNAILRFTSPVPNPLLWPTDRSEQNGGHSWNLPQAASKVKGVISINHDGRKEKPIVFEGTGYHDHNQGDAPLRTAFKQWYWGRVHFNEGTFVYYMKETFDGWIRNGWWVSVDNQQILGTCDSIQSDATIGNLFGLQADTRFRFFLPDRTVYLTMRHTIDSGPFYFRFLSDAEVHDTSGELIERATGISEYLHPDRIHWKRYWPLVHMRLRYADKRPHWVQRFRSLYRWTW